MKLTWDNLESFLEAVVIERAGSGESERGDFQWALMAISAAFDPDTSRSDVNVLHDAYRFGSLAREARDAADFRGALLQRTLLHATEAK